MAMFSERLAYVISANADGAIREFRKVRDEADKSLGDTDARIKRFGSGFKGAAAGAAAGVGGLFAADALAGFAADAIAAAREVEVFRLKTETVFGDLADEVRDWADENNEAFGLTDDRLSGLAASFGDLLVPMGFTRAEAAKMSKSVVGLSGALAAWSGGTRSAAEVSQILAKAMLGERESLKELGISISEADVQTRLAEKGQQGLTGALKEQAEALATQELLFEKSKDAQTAWADGSMDAIKAQNELTAKFAELKEQLGENLLPLAQDLTALAVNLGNAWGYVTGPIREVDAAISAAGDWAKEGAFSDIVRGMGEQAAATDNATTAIEHGSIARQDYIDKTRETTYWLSREAALAEIAADAYESFADRLNNATDSIFAVEDAEEQVADAFDDLQEKANRNAEQRADIAKRHADVVEDSARRIRDAEQDVADAREDLQKISHGDRTDARRRLRDAEERLNDVREDTAKQVEEITAELESWEPTLDGANRAGRENRDLIQEIVEGSKDVATEMAEQGASSDEINRYLLEQRTKLLEIGTQLGFNADELQRYLDILTYIAAMTQPTTQFGSADSLERQAEQAGGLGVVGPSSGVVLNVFTADNPDDIARAVSRELTLLGGRR